jgi:hypothetical protein
VWAALGGPAGKRLAPFMAEALGALERHGELECSGEVRGKLLQVRRPAIRRLIPRVSLPPRMAETWLRSLAKR